MAKENLNQRNETTNEFTISQRNDNLNKEKLNVLSAEDPEKFLSYLILKERWDSKWPDWNTKGSDYGRHPKLITEQVRVCKRLIKNIDSVFQRKPAAKLSKGTVETFCEVGEHNPIVAFLTEAYKKSFSKDGEEYYENWHKNHENAIPKSKGFRKWMIKALVEQRVVDGTPGHIDFDHIDEDIESKIYTEIQRCHRF